MKRKKEKKHAEWEEKKKWEMKNCGKICAGRTKNLGAKLVLLQHFRHPTKACPIRFFFNNNKA